MVVVDGRMKADLLVEGDDNLTSVRFIFSTTANPNPTL